MAKNSPKKQVKTGVIINEKILLYYVLFFTGSSCYGLWRSGTKTGDPAVSGGVTAKPHAEILDIVKPLLEKEGIELETKSLPIMY